MIQENQESKIIPPIARSYKSKSYQNNSPINSQRKEEQIIFDFDKEGQAKCELLWIHMGLDDNSVQICQVLFNNLV